MHYWHMHNYEDQRNRLENLEINPDQHGKRAFQQKCQGNSMKNDKNFKNGA